MLVQQLSIIPKPKYLDPKVKIKGKRVFVSVRKKYSWVREEYIYQFGELSHRTDTLKPNGFFLKNRMEIFKKRAVDKCLKELNSELKETVFL